MTELVLASASPARARLLTAAGVAFTVNPASVDEAAMKDSLLAAGADARAVAEALAELKAAQVSAAMPDVLVLGADQVLVSGGILVSKCTSLGEARALLRELRGQPHELISAAVLCLHGAPVWRHCAVARLTMRDFSDAFLDAYLAAEGEALLGGVGCYRLEERGVQLFERVEGDHFTVQGLPLLPLLEALREQGVLPA